MTDTLTPVERTNWALSTWNSTLDRNDGPYGLVVWSGTIRDHLWTTQGPRVFTWGALASSHTHPPHPFPPPTHPPPRNSGLKLEHTFKKNRLKRLKIKRGTTSKVNYILFNRLLSMVPLNKSGLVRAKPGNFTLKSLNRCFSNYYQVRTWRVFAETVTNVNLNLRRFVYNL